ncbi:MAG: pentapeptide repeat-containing protein [Eubacteriales bacterium]|nr:pentapeptide repeat-containing protein [Eubacteriales bacterium]MDY3332688.1 pentapeptide repeat-containing protein [Gallibacter sp.]
MKRIGDKDISGQDFAANDLQERNFDSAIVKNCNFDDCNLKNATFINSNLEGSTFRRANLQNADLSGANLYAAVFENAILDGVITNGETKWWKLYCPEKGAFIGYKKCMNDRLVQLLIPADAKRTSSTMNCCRCNKAKVLTIKSFDGKESFDEAWSLVDENFVYRKGEWVYVDNFKDDRWWDSTTGIHFWMTREEAKLY